MEIAIVIVIICGVFVITHTIGIVDEHITYCNKSLEEIKNSLDTIVEYIRKKN